MSTNPLKQFSRSPKIYVKPPTLGRFYPEGTLITSPNGEVPIKGMTAADDLIMNNPDALLNGDAVVQLLRSCVGCNNIKHLSVPDVNAFLLGIRYASKGDKLNLKTICPNEECGKESEETVSIRMLLDHTTFIDMLDEPIYYEYEAEDTTIRINIRPSPYEDITKANIVVFEQTRLLQYLQANKEISMDERNARTKEAFDKLAEFHFNTLLHSIESVEIISKNGKEEIKTSVTNTNHIQEFLKDIEDIHSRNINKKLEKVNSIGVSDHLQVICDHCKHEYEMEVKLDPSNFSEEVLLTSEAKKS